ncbi:hypothetical protein [Pelagovum pacificum]|uniref:Porin n=1 Tax=Pelagovum pacificum TaxID=2588711 RepID=A0A5C5GLD5_9RHOB|nr:hypothetical protein [Pelagovum pacificum]QQA42683.1 hypothetical protein I8N54_18210 [Pelagovum pacificum]TNY34166.1 hypothetical protein FHY64_13180 [Pelagovum pacificum]
MKQPWIGAVLATVLLSSNPAVAQQLNGGSVELTYSRFDTPYDAEADGFSPGDPEYDDYDGRRFDRRTLSGAVEVGFGRSFAVQGDLAFHNYGFSDLDGSSVILHGIYHINDVASFGVYTGREEVEGDGVDFYGIEGGLEFGRGEVEAFYATGEYEDTDGDIAGVMAAFSVRPSIRLTLETAYGDFGGGLELDRTAIGAEYDFGAITFSGQYGQGGGSIGGYSGEEAFLALGARYDFGAERGATFENRALGSLIPGS